MALNQKHLLICRLLKKITALPEKIISTSDTLEIYAQTAIKKCKGYLRSDAENWVSVREEEYLEWMDTSDNWPPPATLKPPPRPEYQDVLMSAAKTFWCLSSLRTKHSTDYTMDLSLLHLLSEVSDESSEPAVTQEVIKILANASVHAQYQQLFQQTGWVEKLSEFSKESHPVLFLPAWRALHNLKNHSASKTCTNIVEASQKEFPMYHEGIYPYFSPHQDMEYASVDIILVHGINGGASWTFRQHDTQKHKPIITQEKRTQLYTQANNTGMLDNLYTWCWPTDWLVPKLNVNARVLAMDYRSHWFTWEANNTKIDQGRTIDEHSMEIASILKAAGVGKRPIIWIAHSMGGLIVKNVITNKELGGTEILSSTCGIVFLSVPHHGSQLASRTGFFKTILKPTKEILDLVENSQALLNLQANFENVMKKRNISILSLNETEPMKKNGFKVTFVEPKSADIGIGSFHEIADTTHMDICKPKSRDCKSFKLILGFVQEVLQNLKL